MVSFVFIYIFHVSDVKICFLLHWRMVSFKDSYRRTDRRTVRGKHVQMESSIWKSSNFEELTKWAQTVSLCACYSRPSPGKLQELVFQVGEVLIVLARQDNVYIWTLLRVCCTKRIDQRRSRRWGSGRGRGGLTYRNDISACCIPRGF